MAQMSYLDAALAVLSSTGRPMTVREILDEALHRELLAPAGKTPEATLSATLYVEARENPEGRLIRLHEPGPNRARRGSVRWSLRGSVPS